MITNKEKYRDLCSQELSIPIFSQAWWLDSTAGDCWDVVLLEKGGEILASLPYVTKKRYGFKLLTQPVLTQNLGPWLRPNAVKNSKKLALEKDLIQELYAKLPKHDFYNQNWHYDRTNWLPLYWLDYQQTTKYTYIIPDISNIDKVVSDFEHSKRKNIKKSEKIVKIVFDISPEEFYENHKMTLKKQGQTISYSFEVFYKLYKNGYANNSAKTIAAYDELGNLHAALFVVWDKNSAYNLISTIDPDFRVYGAASLLIRDVIIYVSRFVNKFDFEGSMIEPVERSFRQFGAVQIPYFSIKKTPSRMLRVLQGVHELKVGW
ncbi:methicillin resistance protein [Comamonas sp. GB3 AK4-5]|uniref:methicillin resistance protein n=1 Tax=Comamonas sp. GB3 AK4-5 TaxID=3231487 RepID=UPI00351EB3A0